MRRARAEYADGKDGAFRLEVVFMRSYGTEAALKR